MKKTASKKYKHKRRVPFGRNEIIFLTIVASLFLGLVCGILLCNLIGNSQYQKLSSNLNDFLFWLNHKANVTDNFFVESFIKYAKILVLIWLLAFLPPGIFVSLLLVLIKGLGLGFTTAFFVRELGVKGLYNAALLYFIQNVVLIPTYIYTTYSSIFFVIKGLIRKNSTFDKASMRFQNQFKLRDLFSSPAADFEGRAFIDYLIVLCIGLVCITAASLIECYVVPGLVHYI